MKRFLFSLLALIMCANGLWAQIDIEAFAIDPVEVTPGGHSTILIKVVNIPEEDGIMLKSCGFDLYLPEGVTIDMDEEDFEMCAAHSKFQVSGNYKDGVYKFAVITLNTKAKFVVGDFMEIGINVSEDYNLPTYDATMCGENGEESVIKIGSSDGTSNPPRYQQDAFTFQLVMPMVLDENKEGGYEAFSDYTGKVTVKRTVNAGSWSTICLPLSMTSAELKTVFGDDVQLASFTGCTPTKNKEEVTGLNLHFTAATTLGANVPYLIKSSNAVTQFTLEEATIVDGTPIATGEGGSFIGTYKYISALGSETQPYMFLSGNTFYTAVGNTKMKPFRAYFDLDDLAEYRANRPSSANVNFFIDEDQVTGIDGITTGQGAVDAVYDLQGRQVKVDGDLNSLQKGIYIINGQKVTVK